MNKINIRTGNCLDILPTMDAGSVNCCVTSPPYFGLRDYGNDEQIGLEETPEAFVETMVNVFREVKRVLADDGTLWLNLGDSYAAARGGSHQPAETLAGGKGGKTKSGEKVNRGRHDGHNPTRNAQAIGLKHKDLIGIPWRVALALQADGWYLRQDIIWSKPNPMPESVTDRCTKAHEYIFLLSKKPKYYYDADAVREPHCEAVAKVAGTASKSELAGGISTPAYNKPTTGRGNNNTRSHPDGRNKRSVWEVTTKPYSGAHFATFPPDLIKPCILAGCPTGGTVLDPFGGSGTTGMVALELGRNAELIELNPDYVAIIEERTNVTPGFRF